MNTSVSWRFSCRDTCVVSETSLYITCHLSHYGEFVFSTVTREIVDVSDTCLSLKLTTLVEGRIGREMFQSSSRIDVSWHTGADYVIGRKTKTCQVSLSKRTRICQFRYSKRLSNQIVTDNTRPQHAHDVTNLLQSKKHSATVVSFALSSVIFQTWSPVSCGSYREYVLLWSSHW